MHEQLHLEFWYGFLTLFCISNSLLGGKSSVLMDVKPWDDETDMKKLEEAVRAVELPGLLWGACTCLTFNLNESKL